MKRFNKILSVLLSLLILLMLGSCASQNAKIPEGSIFSEIITSEDGMQIDGLKSGMSVDEVLNALGFSEDDVIIHTQTANYVTPGVNYTQIETKEPYYYSESITLPIDKVFTFKEGALWSMTYRSDNMDADADEFYDASLTFIEGFIANSGAAPLENGEGFEYHVYGSENREDFNSPGAYYRVQFINGGVLGEMGIGSQDVSMSDTITNNTLLNFGIDIMF